MFAGVSDLGEGTTAYTSTIYGLIRDECYDDALTLLLQQLEIHPGSRAALSLSAYCFYKSGDYESAAKYYEELAQRFPSHRYRLYLNHCRIMNNQYAQVINEPIGGQFLHNHITESSENMAAQVPGPTSEGNSAYNSASNNAISNNNNINNSGNNGGNVNLALATNGESEEFMILRAYAKYYIDDLTGLKAILEKLTGKPTDNVCILCLQANLLLKQERPEEALRVIENALKISRDPVIYYTKALALYRTNSFAQCLKTLNDLFEVSARLYPDLTSIKVQEDGSISLGGASGSAIITSPGGTAISGGVSGVTPLVTGNGTAPDFDSLALASLNLNNKSKSTGRVAGVGVLAGRGNFYTRLLRSSLVEACNLKAAVEYTLGDVEAAQRALDMIPPRKDEEIDPVTLHNRAIYSITTDPNKSVNMLRHLLYNPPSPPEILCNLLIIYVERGLLDLVADIMGQERELVEISIPPEMRTFFDAVTIASNCVEEAFKKLNELRMKHSVEIKRLRAEIDKLKALMKENNEMTDEITVGGVFSSSGKLVKPTSATTRRGMDIKTKKLINRGMSANTAKILVSQFAPGASSDVTTNADRLKQLLQTYERKINMFIPILTWQVGILYDMKRYSAALALFQQHADLIEGHLGCSLNIAHIFFCMKHADYETAANHYRAIVEDMGGEDILSLPAVALGNLCVCLLIREANEEAASILSHVERTQKDYIAAHPEKPRPFHHCVMNIIIGTLYASKTNWSFGIHRIIEGMTPVEFCLGPETWIFVKKPLLYLAETLVLNLIPMDEVLIEDVLRFLDKCIHVGKSMETTSASVGSPEDAENRKTIADDARELKAVYMQLL